MAIIKPKVSGNQQVKKFGGKSNGRKGGFGGGGKGGGKGGWGGGKGAAQGGGQWMFIPAAAVGGFKGGGAPQRATYGQGAPQRFGGAPPQRFGGKGGQRFGKGAPVVSFGKGFGGFRPQVAAFGGKGGGGKGKGKREQNPKQAKALDKLGKVEADCKVWVGGLSQEVNRGALHAHFKDTVKPHMFELMSKGTACIAFKTSEDAQLAIDTFNGSELGGKDIQVDVWTKKEKKERPEGEKRERPQKKAGSVIKTSFLKGKKDNKNSPMKTKIKAVDHALKVWVGGLSEKTTWKQLKEHFVASGCEVDLCDMMKPGTACCTFKTEDDASSAVGIMSGTELDDSTIQVDVWTKPERREKKKKEETNEE